MSDTPIDLERVYFNYRIDGSGIVHLYPYGGPISFCGKFRVDLVEVDPKEGGQKTCPQCVKLVCSTLGCDVHDLLGVRRLDPITQEPVLEALVRYQITYEVRLLNRSLIVRTVEIPALTVADAKRAFEAYYAPPDFVKVLSILATGFINRSLDPQESES